MGQAAAKASSSPNGPDLAGTLELSADGKSLTYNGREQIVVAAGAPPERRGGLTIERDSEHAGIKLQTITETIKVTAANMKGWELTLVAGHEAFIKITPGLKLVDTWAGKNNRGVLALLFPDASRAELPPGGFLRYDLFDDGSFYLVGSPRTTVTERDGKRRILNAPNQLLIGSRSPITRISITDNSITLADGLGTKLEPNKEVVLANGTRLEVSRAPDQTLRWRVLKGCVVFDNPDSGCWRVLGLSGQGAEQRTTPVQLTVRGTSRSDASPDGIPIQLSLGNGLAGSVEGSATFQFTNDNRCRTVSAHPTKGNVIVRRLALDDEAAWRGYPVPAAETGDYAGWILTVPELNRATMEVNPLKQMVEFAAPALNSGKVLLEFEDGARAEFDGGARGRLDLLADRTYVLAGQGALKSWNADGQPLSLVGPPLVGGPLVRTPGGANAARFERRRPTITARMVETGAHSVQLIFPNRTEHFDGPGHKTITFANGASANFSYSSDGDLDWNVIKGIFEFSIEGIDQWTAWSVADQSATVSWFKPDRAVDLRNVSPGTPIFVSLPNHMVAHVFPRATFQFASLNSATFASAGSGGAVLLYNLETRQELALEAANQLFRWGQPVGAQATAVKIMVTVNWQTGGPVELDGNVPHTRISLGQSEVVAGRDGARLKVDHHANGHVLFRALTGEFQLRLQPVQNLSVDLPEGTAVALRLETERGLFVARAERDNTLPITLSLGDSLRLPLYASQSFTLTGRAVAHTTLADGDLIFYEGAGAGGVNPFGVAPVNNPLPSPFTGILPVGFRNNQLDVTRIPQPPVSVVR